MVNWVESASPSERKENMNPDHKTGGRYHKLFEPGFMGTLKVKNRLVMAPMGNRLASAIGMITREQIEYYAERARGGI